MSALIRTLSYVCAYILCLVEEAEWPHFGEKLLIIQPYALFVLFISVTLLIFYFGFKGGSLILTTPVSGHCIRFKFQ